MARLWPTAPGLKCLIICSSIFSVAVCLTLNQGTSKPRTTKFSATTDSGTDSQVSPSITTKANSGLAIYRYTKAGATCILLKTDAVVEVYYKLHTLDEKVSSFIPEKPLIEGDCNEDSSFMRISWTGYSLVIYFSKTPGGERWYISKLKLIVSPDLLEFHNTVKQGKSAVKFYHKDMLIAAPVGKSYSCKELEVDLQTDEDDNPPPNMRGKLFLRLLQVQPFMYKGDDFEQLVDCESQLSFRDETAPIAVGSTLAIAVLMTVSGYGIYRYFKVKNVQYNTME